MKSDALFIVGMLLKGAMLFSVTGCTRVSDCDAGPVAGDAACMPIPGGAFDRPTSFVVIDVTPSAGVDPRSAGREVIVRLESGGMGIEPSEVIGEGGWSGAGGVFVTYSPEVGETEVSTLRWIVPASVCSRLNVSATPIGGAITVSVNGKSRHINLYKGQDGPPDPELENGLAVSGCS